MEVKSGGKTTAGNEQCRDPGSNRGPSDLQSVSQLSYRGMPEDLFGIMECMSMHVFWKQPSAWPGAWPGVCWSSPI